MTRSHLMKFCYESWAVGPSGSFVPNPLQRLTQLPLAKGSFQFPFPEDTADPPDLQTTEDQGNQTQLEVSPVQVLHFAPF